MLDSLISISIHCMDALSYTITLNKAASIHNIYN